MGDCIDKVRLADPDVDLLIRTMGAKICDLNGVTVVLDTLAELVKLYEGLVGCMYERDGLQVVRTKNRFHNKAQVHGGYRDIQLLVLMPASSADTAKVVLPMLVEFQLHLRSIYNTKRLSHLAFECSRGSFDPAELKEIMWGKAANVNDFWTPHALEQSARVCAGLVSSPFCPHAVAVLVEQEDSDQLREALHGVLAALLRLEVPVLLGVSGSKSKGNAGLLKIPTAPFTKETWQDALKATRGQGTPVYGIMSKCVFVSILCDCMTTIAN
jgi:hypothetical protein